MIWPFKSRAYRESLPARVGGPGEVVVLVDDRIDRRLVAYHEPGGHQAEQYRGFRTNLRALNPGDAPRSILFTSAHPREGKSVTVANIAAALAELPDLKICLVDADLRAGHLHSLFGVAETPGLTDVLVDGVSPARALHPTALPNLSLVPAGRYVETPGEVLSGQYFVELLSWLKRRHNYIVIDSPPCLAVADACEMSRVSDGVIIVVAVDETTRRDAERALAALAAVGARVLGSFVTGTLPDAEGDPHQADEEPPDDAP